jgi:membrane peptidoglycan carboxypeptidase
MVREGFISKKAAVASLKIGIKPGRLTPITFDFRYFRDWVLSDLSNAGVTLNSGTRIPLTLEVTIQANAERAFR